MTYIVTDACVKCKFMDCVEVCPVDCFYEGENFLVIAPDECIDCAVCIPECPANAIYAEDDLPEGMEVFLQFNKKLAPPLPNNHQKKSGFARCGTMEGCEPQAFRPEHCAVERMWPCSSAKFLICFQLFHLTHHERLS